MTTATEQRISQLEERVFKLEKKCQNYENRIQYLEDQLSQLLLQFKSPTKETYSPRTPKFLRSLSIKDEDDFNSNSKPRSHTRRRQYEHTISYSASGSRRASRDARTSISGDRDLIPNTRASLSGVADHHSGDDDDSPMDSPFYPNQPDSDYDSSSASEDKKRLRRIKKQRSKDRKSIGVRFIKNTLDDSMEIDDRNDRISRTDKKSGKSMDFDRQFGKGSIRRTRISADKKTKFLPTKNKSASKIRSSSQDKAANLFAGEKIPVTPTLMLSGENTGGDSSAKLIEFEEDNNSGTTGNKKVFTIYMEPGLLSRIVMQSQTETLKSVLEKTCRARGLDMSICSS